MGGTSTAEEIEKWNPHEGKPSWISPESFENTHSDIQISDDHVKAEKRYLRTLDFIILPAISALYFFEYLDRGNIAVSEDRLSSCSPH